MAGPPARLEMRRPVNGRGARKGLNAEPRTARSADQTSRTRAVLARAAARSATGTHTVGKRDRHSRSQAGTIAR